MSERLDVAAYYFPNYHPDPRNDAWHGRGWTEWDLLAAARPRYPGHRQPITPAWGAFDESDPAWAAREIDLAADHGIDTFIFDWYHYEDGPYLQHALDRGFLRAANSQRLRFALMWANHDWLNIHPAAFVNRSDVLAPGAVSPAAFDRITDHVIADYFAQPNYWRLEGRPYFSIYDLGTFLAGLGGVDAAAQALRRFDDKTKSAGFPGVHLNVQVWGLKVLPSEVQVRDAASLVRTLSFASAGTYAWVHHHNPDSAGFPIGSYAKAAADNFAAWRRYRDELPVPYMPTVQMGWDPSPRTVQSDKYENKGYPWTAVLAGNTPEAFRAALLEARSFIESADGGPRTLVINAWNEWTEGSYLLPDTVTGMAYLEAVQAATT